jgi:hypothetical protein
MNQVKEIKEVCIKDPENKLWSTETSDLPEIKDIYHHINELEYKDQPNYDFIRKKLKLIFERSQYAEHSLSMTQLPNN